MWKSLFIGGVSAWALAGHAATLDMQRVGTGMQVRTDEGVLIIEPVAPRVVHVRFGPAGFAGKACDDAFGEDKDLPAVLALFALAGT